MNIELDWYESLIHKSDGGDFGGVSGIPAAGDPLHHEPARGQLRPRHRTRQGSLDILRQAAAAPHPGKAPLHDPATAQNRKPLCLLGLLHNFHQPGNPRISQHPFQLRSRIAAVREQLLDPRGLLKHLQDHRRRTVAVPDIGLMHIQHDRRAFNVNRDMPLAARSAISAHSPSVTSLSKPPVTRPCFFRVVSLQDMWPPRTGITTNSKYHMLGSLNIYGSGSESRMKSGATTV